VNVRDIARVSVTDPVDGRRRTRGPNKAPTARAGRSVRVHPLVWETALRIKRPGERIVIVSDSEVRLESVPS